MGTCLSTVSPRHQDRQDPWGESSEHDGATHVQKRGVAMENTLSGIAGDVAGGTVGFTVKGGGISGSGDGGNRNRRSGGSVAQVDLAVVGSLSGHALPLVGGSHAATHSRRGILMADPSGGVSGGVGGEVSLLSRGGGGGNAMAGAAAHQGGDGTGRTSKGDKKGVADAGEGGSNDGEGGDGARRELQTHRLLGLSTGERTASPPLPPRQRSQNNGNSRKWTRRFVICVASSLLAFMLRRRRWTFAQIVLFARRGFTLPTLPAFIRSTVAGGWFSAMDLLKRRRL